MRFIEIPAVLVAMDIINGNMNAGIRGRNPSFLVYTMTFHQDNQVIIIKSQLYYKG